MKAIVFTRYGSPDVLKLQEIEKPTPEGGEVLVKVHAAAINFGETACRQGNTSRRIGHEFLLEVVDYLES